MFGATAAGERERFGFSNPGKFESGSEGLHDPAEAGGHELADGNEVRLA